MQNISMLLKYLIIRNLLKSKQLSMSILQELSRNDQLN